MKSLLYHSHAELKRVTKQVVTGYNKASMKLRAWDEQTFFYALRTLHTHLRSMKKEIPGVRKSNDIESVHKMRVACRRFLTPLEVFADLFPAKSVKSWRKSNRRILRTLRQERDAGIQKEYKRLYQEFTVYWDFLKKENFWERFAELTAVSMEAP